MMNLFKGTFPACIKFFTFISVCVSSTNAYVRARMIFLCGIVIVHCTSCFYEVITVLPVQQNFRDFYPKKFYFVVAATRLN
jgi:hypothetical protein